MSDETVTRTDGHFPFGRRDAAGSKVIGCECGWNPKKRPARMSMQHIPHQAHRRSLKLQPVNYQWSDDSYMEGLSEGAYQQMKGYEWHDGSWIRESEAAQVSDAALAAEGLRGLIADEITRKTDWALAMEYVATLEKAARREN